MAASRHFVRVYMAPVSLPLIKTERFLLSGLGSITFTEEQRAARSLLVTVEKVRPTNANGEGQVIYGYFNQKWPEPQGHWGYWQLLQRDFVVTGGPLSYRREVIFRYEAITAEILGRLRCYLEKEHDYRNAVDDTILGALSEGGPIPGTPNIDELKAVWEASLESQLFPTVPETSVWYELADGWKAQVTITWQAFTPLNCGIEYQGAPPPKAPSAGESGPPGERVSPPPPPDRAVDPLSDNPSPPANAVGGPPVPEQLPPPPPGATRTQLFLEYTNAFAGGGACTLPRVRGLVLEVPGIRALGEFTITDRSPPQPGGPCGSTRFDKNISLDGVSLATGIAEFSTIGFIFSVKYV